MADQSPKEQTLVYYMMGGLTTSSKYERIKGDISYKQICHIMKVDPIYLVVAMGCLSKCDFIRFFNILQESFKSGDDRYKSSIYCRECDSICCDCMDHNTRWGCEWCTVCGERDCKVHNDTETSKRADGLKNVRYTKIAEPIARSKNVVINYSIDYDDPEVHTVIDKFIIGRTLQDYHYSIIFIVLMKMISLIPDDLETVKNEVNMILWDAAA